MKRRELIKLSALAGASIMTGCSSAPKSSTSTSAATAKSAAPRVVVIGGGPGGLAAAKSLKKANPKIDVTIIEKNSDYSTCFGSNWVLGGTAKMEDITFNYSNLPSKHQINVIHDEAIGYDPDKRTVQLAMNKSLEYDRLIISPGISFRWDMVEGHDESTAYLVPHAWKAGYQTMQLRAQIMDMPEDGTMVMAAPPNPFRCPPGPYERASMIAHYMKRHKPKAKLVILDAKDKFSKFGLFKEGWRKNYGFEGDNATIEWVSKSNGGEVKAIDPKTKTITTKNGDKIKADVINYIPPQKANTTAIRMGLVNESGWCPVDQVTFESTMVKNVHVLGDASIAKPMPKSGFSADSQGQLVGKAVAALLAGEKPNASAMTFNQCFSVIEDDYAISVLASYQLKEGKLGKLSGGLMPKDGNFKGEYEAALAWYKNITDAMFN